MFAVAFGTALYVTQGANGAPLKNDPRRDAFAAIRVVFPLEARAGARCIVRAEVGRGWQSRWRHVYRHAVGRAGEVGPFQAHPGWWRDGWLGNRPLWPRAWKIRHNALYAARFARWLWEGSGRRWSVHWRKQNEQQVSCRQSGVPSTNRSHTDFTGGLELDEIAREMLDATWNKWTPSVSIWFGRR